MLPQNPNGYRIVMNGAYVTPVACTRGLYRARRNKHSGRWLFHFMNLVGPVVFYPHAYCRGDTFEQAWIEYLGSVGAV